MIESCDRVLADILVRHGIGKAEAGAGAGAIPRGKELARTAQIVGVVSGVRLR